MGQYNYDKFLLDTVISKLSPDVSPVWFIMDVLSIGKEAAYRRLRGEVALTLKEAVLLSQRLNLSLDEVIGENNGKVRPFRLCLADFGNPREEDYCILEEYVDALFRAQYDPSSTLTVLVNTFPQQLYLRYKNILKFFLLKWNYQNVAGQAKTYHQVKIPDRMQQIFRSSLEAYMQFTSTCFILDKQIGFSFATNLRYFASVGLVNAAETDMIRKEAHLMLNYLEQLAIIGQYENGNKVYMYVSNTSVDRPCFNIKIQKEYLSVFETCILNGIASTDETSYRKMRDWHASRRRLSTLISQSGELQRITFFEELHRQVDAV